MAGESVILKGSMQGGFFLEQKVAVKGDKKREFLRARVGWFSLRKEGDAFGKGKTDQLHQY